MPIDQPHFPTPEEVGDGIVRINCGNDSNNQREHVIAATAQYPPSFFNTSDPRFDFPGPVVLTANPKEEKSRLGHAELAVRQLDSPAANLMFVRLRVVQHQSAIGGPGRSRWTAYQVPWCLPSWPTTMHEPQVPADLRLRGPCYEWRVRHINSYWCPTPAFIRWVMCHYSGQPPGVLSAAAWKAPTAGSAATAKPTICKPSNA